MHRLSAPAAVTLAITLVVVVGWIIGNSMLTELVPGAPPMKVTTAGCLALLAGAIISMHGDRHHHLRPLVMAAAATTTALVLLAAHMLGMNTIARQNIEWAWMSPVSAIALALLGSGLLGAGTQRYPKTTLAAFGLAVSLAMLNVFTAIFGGGPPTFLAETAQMSPITALLVLALAWASVPLLGPMSPVANVSGVTPIAGLSRRLLVAALVLPVVLVALRVRGEAIGLFDNRFGTSLMLIGTIVALVLVVLHAAARGRALERETALVQAERDRFFDLSVDLLSTSTPDGRFARLNNAWTRTLGHSLEALCAEPFLDFVHPEDRDATLYELHRLFAEGKTVMNFQNRFRHADGSYRWLEWSSQPSADASVVYAVARDITVQKQEEQRLTERAALLAHRNEKLEDRAVRDPLTRLHNRAYLEAAMSRLDKVRSGARAGETDDGYAVVLFDLDLFGSFNKEHGHQAGDVVLRQFAEILRRRFRGGDVLCRYGGEEFVAVLSGAAGRDAVHAADEVREALASTPISFDGKRLRATVSAGCAERRDGMTAHQVLAAADVGLSQAKRAGRNCVVAA
ncbi:MAG TPA: sensor domain-containing diguanylate cyclase [Candidatus Limnocylindria bacterium]|nr:sensor domain-containing diguanylate cyclase [Candidatus Limnocylindria bacterium]